MGNTSASPEAEGFLSLEEHSDGAARLATAIPLDVPVDGGTIRVLHIPGTAERNRPVVFIPGWGAILESFHDFYGALSPRTEVYHVETREKTSSSLTRRGAMFSMDRFAGDIARVIVALELENAAPVLMGTCFGAAIILHGLSRGILRAPSLVCVDPMVTLWMPRWIIRVFRPVLPAFALQILRPVLRAIVLAGMREPVQRARNGTFIDAADVWKWREAAIQVRDWSFFHISSGIEDRVYVVNGSHDRFHDSGLFPRVAAAMANGLFVHIPVGESRREALMGVVASTFSAAPVTQDPPVAIEPFVSN